VGVKAHLTSSAAAEIRDAARHCGGHEACGLLFGAADAGGWRIDAASRARNVAGDPQRRFEVDPAHLFAVQRAARAGGPCPIGVWHSHPDGSVRPSALDRAGVTDPSWLWLIAAAGRLAAWAPDDGASGFRPIPLLEGPGSTGAEPIR
jgi:proteasome lid subunit RPN8/RPN11